MLVVLAGGLEVLIKGILALTVVVGSSSGSSSISKRTSRSRGSSSSFRDRSSGSSGIAVSCVTMIKVVIISDVVLVV